MTAVLVPEHTELWRTMPGWGITANLLPPEIVAARRARVIRKIVTFVLAGVLVLGAAGYFLAYKQKQDASSDLTAAQNRTAELHLQQQKYDEVVEIGDKVGEVTSKLGTLFATDVYFPKLLDQLVAKAPRGGAITQLGVAMVGGPTTSTQTSATPLPSVPLDPSGQTPVGTVTITGTARSMSDVATYVTELARVPGVIYVYPTSQQSDDGGTVTYSLALVLTDQVYSHHYDLQTVPTTGGS
jgi:Tfp pilus assembly protein PilO